MTHSRAQGSHLLIQQLHSAAAQLPRSASRSRAIAGIADIVRRAEEAGLRGGHAYPITRAAPLLGRGSKQFA
jgi:hypothetical protein